MRASRPFYALVHPNHVTMSSPEPPRLYKTAEAARAAAKICWVGTFDSPGGEAAERAKFRVVPVVIAYDTANYDSATAVRA